MEKTKKMEKPALDPHREFLDMDTDEEDFGRQESPETEEELPSEPIKPVFNEQDLNKLVQYVKDLTVLPSIKNSDWKEECHMVIREYFENPACALLSIYFEMDALKARLSIPKDNRNDFAYFLRTPWHVFTVDNFHTTVVFGSVNRNTMMYVLKMMENIYVPAALNSDEWSEIVKNNIFFNLHNFLMCLTEWVYKAIGLTKLYVPRENVLDVAESLNNEKYNLFEENQQCVSNKTLRKPGKALIERFEKIVRYWIKQIREVLASIVTNKIRLTVLNELQHWTAIYFNLCCLHDQLSNKEIQLILHLLENVRSPSVDSFQLLLQQLHEGLKQTASNVRYLKILSDACNDLRCPGEIERPMLKILFLILFIWTESPFYNLSNNIEVLCEAISSQIVHQCKNYIDLQAILEDDAKNGINILQKCISCCQTYKTVYDKVTRIIAHIKLDRDWNVNEQVVFNRIDTFIQRCYDVIEICNAIIVFGRRNKVGIIGGAKGTEYEAYCCRIEDMFYENLNEIKLVLNDILDVKKSSWLKNMQRFRNFVTQLENMMKNLIDRIFKEIENVEEGIEIIYSLQRFKHKKCLQDTLSTKWVQIWKIFDREIESCSNSLTLREIYYQYLFQCHSEDATMLCTSRYLERLFCIMIDASDWIGDCAAEKNISYKIAKSLNLT